jgi:hypothetical protein
MLGGILLTIISLVTPSYSKVSSKSESQKWHTFFDTIKFLFGSDVLNQGNVIKVGLQE